MWIQEIEFDVSTDKEQPLLLNEGGINDMGDMSAPDIMEAAEQEFGKYSDNVYDPAAEEKVIGWKFQTNASYEDPAAGGEFTLETWIILHVQPPETICQYYILQDEDLKEIEKLTHPEEKLVLDDLDDVVQPGTDDFVPVDTLIPDPSPDNTD